MTARDIVMSAAGNAGDGKTYIEDVFSTYLYTGNGSTQTINNGIDLAGKGGMVWIKNRNNNPYDASHWLTHQSGAQLNSSSTAAMSTGLSAPTFTNSGFSLNGSYSALNEAYGGTWTYSSWTFRKAPKFFDVVTYTGDGVAGRTISHSLGTSPGMIIIKRADSTSDWLVIHRSVGTAVLNSSAAAAGGGAYFDSTGFAVGSAYGWSQGSYNVSGATYVAYLFAHDTTTDGLIQCGSFTGTAPVTLGWEPQWVLIKRTDAANDWFITDSMRGLGATGLKTAYLNPNTSGAETSYTDDTIITATGFVPTGWAGQTCIYMAIRRGPMRTPTDGTKVFAPVSVNSTAGTKITTGFSVDMQIHGLRSSASTKRLYDRLRGVSSSATDSGAALFVNVTDAEDPVQNGTRGFDNTSYMVPANFLSGASSIYWNFQRAPGFFDVVCYTGTGVARTVNHNLGVAPELIIYKSRSNTSTSWVIQSSKLSSVTDNFLRFDTSQTLGPVTGLFTTPSATTIGFGSAWASSDAATNQSGSTYVAYLFASCPGVSKVGSYTGNGSSQTINCGFSTGARLVLIKRTDSTGDWYVWDTARGIVASNDPHLSLNTTAAEVTTDDTIDPDSTGFIVNQKTATNVNVSGGSYIYLAIA